MWNVLNTHSMPPDPAAATRGAGATRVEPGPTIDGNGMDSRPAWTANVCTTSAAAVGNDGPTFAHAMVAAPHGAVCECAARAPRPRPQEGSDPSDNEGVGAPAPLSPTWDDFDWGDQRPVLGRRRTTFSDDAPEIATVLVHTPQSRYRGLTPPRGGRGRTKRAPQPTAAAAAVVSFATPRFRQSSMDAERCIRASIARGDDPRAATKLMQPRDSNTWQADRRWAAAFMGSPMGQLELGAVSPETDAATSESTSAPTHSERPVPAHGAHAHADTATSAFSGVTHVAEDGTVKYFPANQLMDESWQVDDYDDGG